MRGDERQLYANQYLEAGPLRIMDVQNPAYMEQLNWLAKADF